MVLLLVNSKLFAQRGNFKKNVESATIALKHAEQIKDKPGIIKASIDISEYSNELGQYLNAIQYAQYAADLSKQIGNDKLLSQSLNKLGNGYNSISDYPKALNCFLQQLKVLKNIDDPASTANALGNIGLVYGYLKKYPEALDYDNKCINALTVLNDRLGAAAMLSNMGAIYLDKGDYLNAIDLNKRALYVNMIIKNPKGMANNLLDIGVASYKEKNYVGAYNNIKQALVMFDTLGAKNNTAIAFGHLAIIYTNAPANLLPQIGISPALRIAKVIELHLKAVQLAHETKNLGTEAEQWKNLTYIYEQQNNYKEAYKSYRYYTALNDSIFNDKKRNEINRLNIANELDKRAADLKAEKQTEVSWQTLIKNAAIFIGIVLLLLNLIKRRLI